MLRILTVALQSYHVNFPDPCAEVTGLLFSRVLRSNSAFEIPLDLDPRTSLYTVLNVGINLIPTSSGGNCLIPLPQNWSVLLPSGVCPHVSHLEPVLRYRGYHGPSTCSGIVFPALCGCIHRGHRDPQRRW